MNNIIQFPSPEKGTDDDSAESSNQWETLSESSSDESKTTFEDLGNLPEFQESESLTDTTKSIDMPLDETESNTQDSMETRINQINQSNRDLDNQHIARQDQYYNQRLEELNQEIAENPSLSTNPEYLSEKQEIVSTLAVNKDMFEALNDPKNADTLPGDLYQQILDRYNHILDFAGDKMSSRMRDQYIQQSRILQDFMTTSATREDIEKDYQPANATESGDLPGDIIS